MEKDPRILSLSFDSKVLERREAVLRANGFDVKSVYSPAQARFEIERRTFGIFVTSQLVPNIVNQDLINLFRQYCPEDGFVILVASDEASSTAPYEPHADVRVPESRDPEGIVQALRDRLPVPQDERTPPQ